METKLNFINSFDFEKMSLRGFYNNNTYKVLYKFNSIYIMKSEKTGFEMLQQIKNKN